MRKGIKMKTNEKIGYTMMVVGITGQLVVLTAVLKPNWFKRFKKSA